MDTTKQAIPSTKPTKPPQAPPSTIYLHALATVKELQEHQDSIKRSSVSFDPNTSPTYLATHCALKPPPTSTSAKGTMTVFYLPRTKALIGITPHLTELGNAFNSVALFHLFEEAKALERETGISLSTVL